MNKQAHPDTGTPCLHDYFMTQTDLIETYYGPAVGEFSVEAVHDFRVAVKRLRAFCQLIERITTGFAAKKEMKSTRRIFKAAGPLRDVHVQQELFKAWAPALDSDIAGYWNYLKAQEMAARDRLAERGAKFTPSAARSIWPAVAAALTGQTGEQVIELIHQHLFLSLNTLIRFRNKGQLSEDDYHRIRILTKRTRYVLEVYRGCRDEEEAWCGPLNKGLRNVHRALGKWHDCDTGERLLAAFRATEYIPSDAEARRYEDFSRYLREEHLTYLHAFDEAWRSFLSELPESTTFSSSSKKG